VGRTNRLTASHISVAGVGFELAKVTVGVAFPTAIVPLIAHRATAVHTVKGTGIGAKLWSISGAAKKSSG